MKLRLPIFLAAAVMAVFSSSSVRATEYTWTGASGADVHIEGNWNPGFEGKTWTQVWASETDPSSMFFSKDVSTANKTLNFSFNPICLSGIRVEAGATGYALEYSTGGVRNMQLRTATAGTPVLFSIGENFRIGSSTVDPANERSLRIKAYTDVNFDVASGKTLDLYAHMANSGDNVAHTYTVGSQAGYNGTVNIYYAADAGFNQSWVVSNGATLADKVGGALGTGSLSIGAGSKVIIEGAGTYVASGNISGAGSVQIITGGTGVVTLGGATNDLQGGVLFDGTKLTIGSAGVGNGGITMSNAASSLVINGASAAIGGTLSFAGSAEIGVAADGSVITIAGSKITGATSLKKSGLGELDITGSLASSIQAVEVATGRLSLANTGYSNLISNTAALTLSGGTLILNTGASNGTQTVASTTLANGTASYLELMAQGAASMNFYMGTIIGTGSLTVTTTGNFILNSSSYTTPGQELDNIKFKTVSGFVFGKVDTSGNIVPGASLQDLPSSGAVATSDYQLLGSQTVTASQTVKSLYVANSVSTPGDIASNTLTMNSGVTQTVTDELSVIITDNYKITGGTLAAGSLTKAGTGTLLVDSILNVAGATNLIAGTLDLTVASGQQSVLGGAVTGTGTLIKKGEGTLVVSGAVDASTGITLQEGALNFTSTTFSNAPVVSFLGGSLQWATGNTTGLTALLAKAQGSVLKFDTNGNDVDLLTAQLTLGSADTRLSITKEGNGTLSIGKKIINQMDMVINGGVVNLTGDGGAAGTLKGTVTINNSGKLILSGNDATGYNGGTSVISHITINKGGIMEVVGTAPRTPNQTFAGTTVTLVGGQITGNASFDAWTDCKFETKASDTTAQLNLAKIYLRSGNNIPFDVERYTGAGDSYIDLLVNSILDQHGVSHLTKNGAGVMAINSETNYGGTTTINDGTFMIGTGGTTGRLHSGVDATIAINADSTAATPTSGILAFNRTDDYGGAVTNVISGNGTIKLLQGSLTLGGANSSFSGNTVIAGGTLKAGDGNVNALGTSTVTIGGGGTLDMNNNASSVSKIVFESGGIINAGALTSATNYAINAKGSVNLQGLTAAAMAGVSELKTLAANAQVLNVPDSISVASSKFTLGTYNMAADKGGDGNIIVNFADTSKVLTLGQMTLDLNNVDFNPALGTDIYTFLITNGTLAGDILTTTGGAYGNITLTGDMVNLNLYEVGKVENGNVIIRHTGSAWDLIIPVGQQRTFTSQTEMDSYVTVTVNGTMNVQMAGAGETLTVKELHGQTTGVINSNGTAANTTIDLNMVDTYAPGHESTFGGTITGPASIDKTGDKSLTISGMVNLNGTLAGGAAATGDLTVSDGSLTLNGGLAARNVSIVSNGTDLVLGANTANTMQNLAVSTGKLTLGDSSTTTAGTLTTVVGTTIALGTNAKLAVSGNTTVNSALTGNGIINISSGRLDFAPAVSDLGGNSVEIDNGGSLNIGATGNTIKTAAVNGPGTVTGTGGTLALTGNGNSSIGALDGTGSIQKNGTGTLALAGAGNSGYNVAVNSGTLELKGAPVVSLNNLNMADGTSLNLGETQPPYSMTRLALNGSATIGSSTVINAYLNPSLTSPVISAAGPVSLGSGVVLNVYDNATAAGLPADDWKVTLAHSDTGVSIGSMSVVFKGYYNNLFTGYSYDVIGNDLVLTMKRTTSNPFSSYAYTNNQQVAAGLMWGAINNYALPQSSVLYQISSALGDARLAGDVDGVSRSLSAISGSSFTSMLSAERSALAHEVLEIRNHVTKLGVDNNYINTDMPYFHAWITGNGSYDKLSKQGDDAGYELNTWGGTVGFDVDATENTSFGLAFSTLYGKLRTSSIDYSDGDHDGYYVNLYGRYQHKRWSHSLILTGGWSDIKQDRTVTYVGGNSYATSYKTEATGFNAFYEGAYDVYLNDKKTSILQPLFNASISTIKVNDFNESGTHNAIQRASDMDMTYGTLGVGARLVGEIGTNTLGVPALGEVFAVFSQDIGDTRSKANVEWVDYRGYGGEVHGSKVGKSAIQAGAGVTVPVGEQGAIFGDANVDLRSHATAVFGRLGYRYTF